MDTMRSILSKFVGPEGSGRALPSSRRAVPSEIQPLDTRQQKMFEAMLPVVVSATALDFGPLSDDRVQRTVTILNPNRPDFPPVAWKALTNFQHHYCVRPNMGVLKSGDCVSVLLIRETAQRHANKPSRSRRPPAFLIRSTPILEQWYPMEGRKETLALWKRLTNARDHLMTEHKILANKPEPFATSVIIGEGQISSGESDAHPATELAHLRAENALLRAQVSTLSVPSASASGLNTQPISEYEWEDAAPSYQESLEQDPPPRFH